MTKRSAEQTLRDELDAAAKEIAIAIARRDRAQERRAKAVREAQSAEAEVTVAIDRRDRVRASLEAFLGEPLPSVESVPEEEAAPAAAAS